MTEPTEDRTESQDQPRKSRVWLIVVAVVLVVGAAITWWRVNAWATDIENEGQTWQNEISQLRDDVETTLGECLDKSAVAAQIAQEQYKTLKDIVVSAAAARYENNAALGQGGAMFSALAEQYPQVDQTTWGKLLGTAVGCRGEVADTQRHLRSHAARFESWTDGGSWPGDTIRNNFPNHELSVVNPLTGKTLVGEEALKHIIEPISTKEAKEAMGTKEMPSQTLFPSSPPSN